MNVNFGDLKAQYNSIKDQIDNAIKEVIYSCDFINGRYTKEFEANFSKFIGIKHCIGVGNGTDALFIALKALGINERDEVITVANSFIATSEAITMSGAKVVFVDCHKDTSQIDVNKIEKAITEKTKCIIPVHLYGQPSEMDKIIEIAKEHKLYVIEDAAQAHGAKYKGKNIGTIGDIACFSFFPGKNLGAYGDAGAIVTDNDELAKNARMFANHGRLDKYNHEFEGTNSRMDGLQGAILNIKLKYLAEWTRKRREIAEYYNRNLKEPIILPHENSDLYSVYHLYVIRIKERDKVQARLKEQGIATGIHYPIPLPFLNAYRYLKHTRLDFPVAAKFAEEILSLPIYPELTESQLDYVVKAVNSEVH